MTKANKLDIINVPGITMSSREIAALTEKNHRHVRRDVKKMFFELGIEELEYVQLWTDPQNGEEYEEFLLPKDLTLTLVSGYNVKLRKKIIDRWMELEGERETKVAPPRKPRSKPFGSTFRQFLGAAKALGYDDRTAAFHANVGTRALTNVDVLGSMGVKTLPALENERTLSPTEIGEKLGLSAQRVNEMLCHLGLQHHTYDKRRHRIYHLTGLGKEYGRLEDASRAHSDGSVTVLRWYPRVIDQLEKHLQAQRYPRLEQGLPVAEVVA